MTGPTIDDCFKTTIDVFALAKSTDYYDDNWVLQVQNLDKYWDEIIDKADRESLKYIVLREANELGIENAKDYDFEKACFRAKTEWRKELVLQSANYITSCYIDFDEDKEMLVKWEENEIDILWHRLRVSNE